MGAAIGCIVVPSAKYREEPPARSPTGQRERTFPPAIHERGGLLGLVILWDIDKTLVRPYTGEDLFRSTFQELFGPAQPVPEVEKDGKTDLQIVLEYVGAVAGARQEQAALAHRFLEKLDERSLDAFAPGAFGEVPGADGLLALVMDHGLTNAVFTGNTATRARAKLVSAGIDPSKRFGNFAHGEGFFQGARPSRLDGATRVFEAFPASHFLVVGDSPRDYALAKFLGCPFWQVGHASLPEQELLVGSCEDFLQDAPARFIDKVMGMADADS